MALRTRSPATLDAQRLRDMSDGSSNDGSADEVEVGAKAGRPFMCCACVLSNTVLACGELWLEGTLAAASGACGEPFTDGGPANPCCSLMDRSLSMSETHVKVFFKLSTMFWVSDVCPLETASLPVLAATAILITGEPGGMSLTIKNAGINETLTVSARYAEAVAVGRLHPANSLWLKGQRRPLRNRLGTRM